MPAFSTDGTDMPERRENLEQPLIPDRPGPGAREEGCAKRAEFGEQSRSRSSADRDGKIGSNSAKPILRPAFPIAACLAVYIPFHGSGGWDYQNAASGAFYIIAFYLLTSAVLSKQPRWQAIGAGAAYAAAVHATIGFVNLAPIFVFHCFALYRHQFGQFPSWRYVLWIGVWFLFGALILTVLLGLANLAVGREFIFFKPLLDLVMSLSSR